MSSTTLPPWTTIPSTDRDAGAPITGWLMSANADNLTHSRVVCYDPATHTAATAHDHDGVNSAHVSSYPGTPSLVRYGHLDETIILRAASGWVFHGASLDTSGVLFGAAQQWITCVLVDADRPPYSRSLFGSGCDLVVSMYIQATATLTAGQMAIGLVDGGAEPKDDAKTFVDGTRVIVPYSLAPVSSGSPAWQRVWAVIPDVMGRFDKACRVCVQCEETPEGGAFRVNLVDVRPGRQLDFWAPSYHSDAILDWAMYGVTGPAPLDQSIAITNAIKLSPGDAA